MESEFITEIEVTELIGMSRSWLQQMRVKGGGIPFYRYGNAVRYKRQEVIEWRESRRCISTSCDAYKAAREADDLQYWPKRKKSMTIG